MATDISLRDRELLDAASNNASGAELEAQFGLPAKDALSRVRGVLESKSVWDEVEQRKLLMHSIFKIKSELEKDFDMWRANPKMIGEYTKMITLLDKMLDKQNKISDDEMNRLNSAQAQHLMTVVELAYYRARDVLQQQFADTVDIRVIDAAFRDGLRAAATGASDG